MTKLPFKAQPQDEIAVLGNEKSGTLEVAKLFGLSPLEIEFIEAAKTMDFTKDLVKLAKEIVTKSKTKLNFVAVYNQLRGFVFEGFDGIDETKADFIGEHFDRINQFQTAFSEHLDQRSYVRVQAILKFRLGIDLTITELKDPKIIRPALLADLALFAQREESGDAEPTREPEITTEDQLGESSAA